jgi:hypothetical protein
MHAIIVGIGHALVKDWIDSRRSKGDLIASSGSLSVLVARTLDSSNLGLISDKFHISHGHRANSTYIRIGKKGCNRRLLKVPSHPNPLKQALHYRELLESGQADSQTELAPALRTNATRPSRGSVPVGRRQWRKESGAHLQAQAENGMYRYKRIIGDGLRARHHEAQKREALIAVNVINRMTALGMPESVKVVV